MDPEQIWLPLSGLVAGTALGFIARRNFFCTLSALEQHWYGGNSDGLRIWVLSAVVAAAITQSLSFSGLIDVSQSFYLSPVFGWLGTVIGGISFGIGMALVGTCSFGALVRLGGGSLKSLIACIVLAIAALSTQRGLLAFSRTEFFDHFAVRLPSSTQTLPDIISAFAGINLLIPATVIIIAIPFTWVFSDPKFRRNLKAIVTGTAIGVIVTFGWIVTSKISTISFTPVTVESASFVAPVGALILKVISFAGNTSDYSVALVPGVIIGAAIAAFIADDVRWEACDDARELSRHIVGALAMGFGGILAAGCTIGQGVSAASLLVLSAPVALASIVLGARIGLAWLLEGSLMAAFRR